MPDAVSPRLSLPYIQPAQAQKHVTHNEALRCLDAIVHLAVLDADRTDPPAAPAMGDRHIVAAGATGAWAGQDHAVAVWEGSWVFYAPQPGWQAWIQAAGAVRIWTGSTWTDPSPFGGAVAADTVGVNAAADPVNRVSVAAAATLLSHEGAGHQLKINKAAATDTASLLFQTGFSGRAEIGTIGSGGLAVKVSADGATWKTALSVDPATGRSALAAGSTVGGSVALSRADLVGPVAESAGVPTGAAIERGRVASGDWVRFADGTQICTHYLTTSDTAAVTWTFPRPFVAADSRVNATPAAAAARLITLQGATADQILINGWTLSGARTACGVYLTATGRWF